jgi:predicted amidohydrolase
LGYTSSLEYFRELYKQQVQLCCVSLCDVAEGMEDASRRSRIIEAHLLTRAVENGMVVASVNSMSRPQTAPTAVFDANGHIVASAQANQEELLVYDYKQPEMSFGLRGRHENIKWLLGE